MLIDFPSLYIKLLHKKTTKKVLLFTLMLVNVNLTPINSFLIIIIQD